MNATPTPQRPSLGLALRHAHLRAARLFAEELKPLDMENVHAGIFMHVGLLGVLTQRQLVDSMGVDKSAMVRALDALEARGLVRHEEHPTDRRAPTVIPTDAGRVTLERVVAAVRRTEERMTSGFTPEETELFHSLVLRFAYPCPEAPSDTPTDGPDDASDEYA